MRFQRFVAVVAGLLLGLATASVAHAQPRPSDAEPLDFLPPPATELTAPAAPRFSPAPDVLPAPNPPSNSYSPAEPIYAPPASSSVMPSVSPSAMSPYSSSAAPSYSPPYSVVPSAGPAEMPPEISPYVDKSRYLSYGGRIWYLQPGNHWTYWSEGRWVDYQPARYSNTPAYVQPPGNPRRWNRIISGAPLVAPPAAAYRPATVPAYPAAGY